MEIILSVKRKIKRLLRRLGYRIEKLESENSVGAKTDIDLLPNGFIAYSYSYNQKRVAFRCQINQCVHPLGWSYGKSKYTPHKYCAYNIINKYETSYEQSSLKKFYQTWRPTNVSNVCPGLRILKSPISDMPGYAIRCSPWKYKEVDDYVSMIVSWFENDAEDHLGVRLAVSEHGYKSYGPVSRQKGCLEFNRLSKLVLSISKHGYLRNVGGDVMFTILRRGEEVRYMQTGSGYHRTAVLAALGEKWVPARFYPFSVPIVNIRDASSWPGVRSGLWDHGEAIRYFNYLFDFDSREWAERYGFIQR